jgi:hypothetical protein
VQVFVVPYGAINEETGNATRSDKFAPIEALASFYVTGFDGDESRCIGKENAGTQNENDPTVAGRFEIWGHFIKYVALNGESKEGGKCVLGSLGTCVATLTE